MSQTIDELIQPSAEERRDSLDYATASADVSATDRVKIDCSRVGLKRRYGHARREPKGGSGRRDVSSTSRSLIVTATCKSPPQRPNQPKSIREPTL